MATHGVKLSEKKVAQIWALYSQGISEQAISKKLSVSRNTIAKYRKREKWDERKKSIVTKANKMADKQQASWLAKTMAKTENIIDKLYVQIEKSPKNKISKTPVSDFDRMARLRELLAGHPDSRPQIDYSKLSEEQLTIEVRAMIIDLMEIPECKAELQKLLTSGKE